MIDNLMEFLFCPSHGIIPNFWPMLLAAFAMLRVRWSLRRSQTK